MFRSFSPLPSHKCGSQIGWAPRFYSNTQPYVAEGTHYLVPDLVELSLPLAPIPSSVTACGPIVPLPTSGDATSDSDGEISTWMGGKETRKVLVNLVLI
jgi:hypothetical protein